MLESSVKILIISATAVYGISFLLAVFKRQKSSLAVFFLGWMINLAVFVINWIIAKNPPFGNMYHVMSFLPLCLLPLYLYVKYIQKLGWLLSFFAISAALPLFGTLFMKHEVVWNRMPALQSPWFVPHVSAYILSYSLAAVAFLLVLASTYHHLEIKNIFRLFKDSKGNPFPFLIHLGRVLHLKDSNPDSKRYSAAAYKIMLIAFPFMTFGLFSGALWAEEAWGSYWTWDIKEVWSLITWGLYLIYFHCRLSKDIQNWQRIAHIFAFFALLITFFVVNFLPKITSLHSYAM